ncbi:hypothetical protein Tco_1136603 [Tanacetum coccineum]
MEFTFSKWHCAATLTAKPHRGSTSTSDPPTDEWINGRLPSSNHGSFLPSPTASEKGYQHNPASAKAAWDTSETFFPRKQKKDTYRCN